MKIQEQAPAKINLTLDILGRRSDGYHELRMVMQSVSLCDTVTVEETAPASHCWRTASRSRRGSPPWSSRRRKPFLPPSDGPCRP